MPQTSKILSWIFDNDIRNEKGEPITFHRHMYLVDIYLDQSPNLCVMKGAQVGMSTAAIIKNHFDAKDQKLDIIYTLPTDGDVNVFVSGKVNRIIANNACMLEDVKDKDSIEQKQIGDSFEYFRGTWTKKAAIMITADRLTHDEIDSSKQDVVRDYQARLQHSRHKQTHVFSHPSTPKNGVHLYWLLSDQKEFFIMCPHCGAQQYLSWNTEEPAKMSIDLMRKIYVCKKCHAELSDDDRAVGVWKARKTKEKPKWSGYHCSLLMNPDVSAAEIIEKWSDPKQTKDFFYNKVLGLPYAGGGNTVSEDMVLHAITAAKNNYEGRLVIGVDPGLALRYVIGNLQGLVGYGEMKAYEPDEARGIPLEETLEYFLKRFPDSVMIIDQGGDVTPQRALREKYPGRVYLCHYRADRKTMQLFTWGEGDESGNVVVDRNRAIQLVSDEMRDGRFFLYNGTADQWHDYALHWTHIYRVWEENALGVRQYKWLRNDRDDYVHCTVYWRAGVSRFGHGGAVYMPGQELKPNSYMLNADGKSVSFNPDTMFRKPEKGFQPDDYEDNDWRNI